MLGNRWGFWGQCQELWQPPFLGVPSAACACSAAAGVPAAQGLTQHPAFSPKFYSEGEIWSKETCWVVGLFALLGLAEGKHFFFSPCKGITGGFPISEDSLHTEGAWVGSRAHRESHRVPAPSQSHSGKVSGRPPSPPAPRHPAGVPTLTPLHLLSVAACIAYSRALLRYCQTFFFSNDFLN